MDTTWNEDSDSGIYSSYIKVYLLCDSHMMYGIWGMRLQHLDMHNQYLKVGACRFQKEKN